MDKKVELKKILAGQRRQGVKNQKPEVHECKEFIAYEGFIVYSPKGRTDAIIQNVVHIEEQLGLLGIWIDLDGSPFEAFLYNKEQNLWMVPKVPNKNDWKFVEWKNFEGTVLAFEYKIRLIKE